MGLSRLYIQLLVAILFSLSANAQWIPIPFGTGASTAVVPYTWSTTLKGTNMALSGGNLIASNTTSSPNFSKVLGVRGITRITGVPDSSKGYFEVVISGASTNIIVGWALVSTDLNTGCAFDADSWGWVAGRIYNNLVPVSSVGVPGAFAINDTLMIALDMYNGAAYCGKNGTWLNGGVPSSGALRTGAALTWTADARVYYPCVGRDFPNVYTANFGTALRYTVPTGYRPFTDY